MTKDGMKDKISMALKDPILQMGFEVICSKLSRLEKENAELKEKISVLLSCKNCPENKGGWICEKEYENKCLTQKIVYIKELKEENAELDCQMNRNKSCYSCANATDRCFRNEIGCPCEKYKSYKDENAEMKAQIKLLTEKVGFWEEQTKLKKAQIEEYDRLNMFDVARTDELREKAQKQLTKAKEIIKEMLSILPKENIEGVYEITEEAEQFIKEMKND